MGRVRHELPEPLVVDLQAIELSERLEVEAEAIEAFETCLAEAGLGVELHEDQEMPPVVTIETADGLYVVEFGSATGSVAISGDADGVSVTTSGGVSVLDEADLEAEWRAFEAAHELCEELLATE